MKKDKVLETINLLPEEFSLEELVEKLLFIEKVEKGFKDAKEGRTIGLKDAKQMLSDKWKATK